MAGIGKTEVQVFLRPRVGIISSGDEIIPIEKTPNPGEIRDINRYAITSMVRETREGFPSFSGSQKIGLTPSRKRWRRVLKNRIWSSSPEGVRLGTLDLTLDVLQTFAGTELLIHGVSVRPGKPTLIADVHGKPFLGLPGHPVSAMVIFPFFGKPF